MTATHPSAVAAVITAMEHYDRAWQRALADFKTVDGDIDERRQRDYEYAKDDHAWPVLEALPDWIAALKAATAPETAPEHTP